MNAGMKRHESQMGFTEANKGNNDKFSRQIRSERSLLSSTLRPDRIGTTEDGPTLSSFIPQEERE